MLNISKKITSLLCIIFAGFILTSCTSENKSHEKKIGLIVPIENKSLNEIVTGFVDELHRENAAVKIKVANAQNDLNLQRAIIAQLKNEHFDIIVPIGTAATQMTLSMVKHIPIISLAANYTEGQRQALTSKNLAVIHDEIPSEKIVDFIHTAFPNIKHLVLIHSGTEKIYKDIETTVKFGRKYGMTIHPLMAATLNDLYSTANNLPSNTQAILILKDILITSGISTLVHAAERKHILLMASDQGSVKDGAGVALGVHEEEIGILGAKLTSCVLQGKAPNQLPIKEMRNLTIFINPESLKKEHFSLQSITQIAKIKGYDLVFN